TVSRCGTRRSDRCTPPRTRGRAGPDCLRDGAGGRSLARSRCSLVGDAAVTPGVSPLEGLRILAATQLGAGPFAMMFLSDLGAEVIKIEDPATGADAARRLP